MRTLLFLMSFADKTLLGEGEYNPHEQGLPLSSLRGGEPLLRSISAANCRVLGRLSQLVDLMLAITDLHIY